MGLVSACAKFQFSSWSRSGWKVCGSGWWGGEHLTTVSNSNASCFRVSLRWVELGWVLTISFSLTHPSTHWSDSPTQRSGWFFVPHFCRLVRWQNYKLIKNMYNMPRILGVLPRFTNTLWQTMSIFLSNIPRILGLLILINSFFLLDISLKDKVLKKFLLVITSTK